MSAVQKFLGNAVCQKGFSDARSTVEDQVVIGVIKVFDEVQTVVTDAQDIFTGCQADILTDIIL